MEVKKEHKQDTRENQADIHTSNLTKNAQVGTGKPQSRKAAKSSKQRSEMFFDQISYRLKTINVIQNQSKLYMVHKKLSEALKRIDEACEED